METDCYLNLPSLEHKYQFVMAENGQIGWACKDCGFYLFESEDSQG